VDVGEPEPHEENTALPSAATAPRRDRSCRTEKIYGSVGIARIRMVCITGAALLQSAPHASRNIPAVDGYCRRRSAPRRRATDQGHGGSQAIPPRPDGGRLAYSYLQEWLPNVAQRVLREDDADFIGLGRMVLPYPEMCADVLAGRPLQASASAARSATAQPARETAWSRVVIRLDDYYRQRPSRKAQRDEETG